MSKLNGHTNEFRQEEGNLKVYVPDGHLFEGAGEMLWKYTGLPWSTLNWEHGRDVGSPMKNGGNGYSSDRSDKRNYVIVVDESELRKLGYPIHNLKRLIIALRRPHNIPEEQSVSSWGIGISGKDLIADRLEIDVLHNYDENFFTESTAENSNIRPMGNLGYRPSRLAFAFPERYKIDEPGDIRRKTPINGKYLLIATEFPWLAKVSLKELTGMKDIDEARETARHEGKTLSDDDVSDGNHFKIIKTDGKTEPYAMIEDTDGIMDVGETFKTVRQHGLLPIEPVLMRSTPYLMVNKNTYGIFTEFVDELYARIEEGRGRLTREDETMGFFEDRHDPSVFEFKESFSERISRAFR